MALRICLNATSNKTNFFISTRLVEYLCRSSIPYLFVLPGISERIAYSGYFSLTNSVLDVFKHFILEAFKVTVIRKISD